MFYRHNFILQEIALSHTFQLSVSTSRYKNTKLASKEITVHLKKIFIAIRNNKNLYKRLRNLFLN